MVSTISYFFGLFAAIFRIHLLYDKSVCEKNISNLPFSDTDPNFFFNSDLAVNYSIFLLSVELSELAFDTENKDLADFKNDFEEIFEHK